MGQTRGGKERKFLTTHQRVQQVNGRNTGLNKLVGVVPRVRIHRIPVDIEPFFGDNLGTFIYRPAESIEDPAQHIKGYAELNAFAKKLDRDVFRRKPTCAFKNLHHGFVFIDFKHTSSANGAVRQFDIRQFSVCDAFNAINQDKGPDNFFCCTVFSSNHGTTSYIVCCNGYTHVAFIAAAHLFLWKSFLSTPRIGPGQTPR